MNAIKREKEEEEMKTNRRRERKEREKGRKKWRCETAAFPMSVATTERKKLEVFMRGIKLWE